MHVFLLSVFAVDFQTVSQVSEEKERNAYIADVLPQYLTIDGNELPQNAVISISDPIRVINNPDAQSRVYLIMVDNHYYAKLIVTSSDGKYYSSFMFDENEKVDILYQNKTPFAFAVVNDELVIVTDDGCESFYNALSIQNSVITSMSNVTLSQYNWFEIDFPIESVTQSQRSVNDYSVSLSVPYVANNYNYSSGGMCWAACIAAISNYFNETNYTALSLYNLLAQVYNDTPDGYHQWYIRGYEYCNVPIISRAAFTDIMDYYAVLNEGIPVQLRVYPNASSDDGHAIIMRSFEGGNEYVRLGFMDPNYSTVQYALVPYDSYGEADIVNEFRYPRDIETYTNIRYVFYKDYS